ncbi:hypothetical protein OAK75_12165 [Bacteriovoracales bacterium]|nr:hypothetical protein [Bacteriovoracales bacterium]
MSESLKSIGAKFVVNNFLILGLAFFKSILIIRVLQESFYGKYQYILAICYFTEVLTGPTNFLVQRFYKIDVENRYNIMWGSIIFKLLFVFVLVFFGLFLAHYFNFSWLRPLSDLLPITVLILASIFFNTFLNSFKAILVGMESYDASNMINFFEHLASFLLVVILFMLKVEKVSFLYLFLFSNSIIFSIEIFVCRKLLIEKSIWPKKNGSLKLFELIKKGVWSYKGYFLPLIGSSGLAGYLRKYIASFIFGIKEDFVTVTYYEVLKKIYDIIRKVIPSLMLFIVPTITPKIHDKDFSEKWSRYIKYYFSVSLIIGIFISLLLPFILKVYGLKEFENYELISFLFNLSLIFTAGTTSVSSLIFTQKKTTILLWGNIGKHLFLLTMIFLFNGQINMLLFCLFETLSFLPLVLVFYVWCYGALSNYREMLKWNLILMVLFGYFLFLNKGISRYMISII